MKTKETKEFKLNISFSKKDVITAVIFFGVYIFTAQISRLLFNIVSSSSSSFSAVILTPAGIALAGLILYGFRFWPVIALASIINGIFFGSASILLVLFSTIGSVTQALVGLYILHKTKFNPAIIRIREIMIFVVVAVLTTMIGPTIAFIGRWLTHSTPLTSWSFIWLGGMLSVAIFMPFLVTWVRFFRIKQLKRNITETVIAFSALILIDFLIFWTSYTNIKGISLALVQLAILFWIAVRLRALHITLALLLTTLIGLSGPFLGTNIPAAEEFSRKIVGSEIYLIIFAILFYSITTISHERDVVNKSLKKTVYDLEKALESIKLADMAKTEFISILAHELRNPLAPIVSYIELIKNDIKHGSVPASNYVDTIETNVRNIARLLDDLLDVSRISQQKFTMHKEIIVFQDVINFAIETSIPAAKARRIDFSYSIPEDKIFVEMDPVRFQQVLLNVINNAIKYTKPSGHISLICTQNNDEAVIKIKDNGVGIAPEMIDRVFEPFTQAETKYLGIGGLGIGLYLSKKFTELHNGTIVAHSAGKDMGSEFIIQIPLSQKAETNILESVAVKNTENSGNAFRINQVINKKYRILVVDDNEAAAEALAKLLQYVGHDVEMAFDGKLAIEMIKDFRPNIVLLDIGLPGMNGYEVAKKIRQEVGSAVTLIALTGYGQEEDKIKSKETGFDHHLTKPIGLAEIETIINTLSEPIA